MKITIMPDEKQFDVTAAWRIIAQIMQKPDSVIGLSTGQTTGGMHRIVSGIYREYPFDVAKVTFFNVDELTNLDRAYAGSCYTMIYEQLVKPLGIHEDHFIMPPTLSDDFAREARIFEERLA
ncbi:MAG: hypothetical protein K6T85_17670, partial [Gorillibacterium sp.]|nr:hypothetical protein [Gorillibacterium sp.]